MDEHLRIGEVATRSGVSVDTVRFYERRSLLPTASRTPKGYRVFTAEAIERVHFIKQAQELGFTLDEIGILLRTTGVGDCLHVHDLLERKLKEIDTRMAAMLEFREKVRHYLVECEEELRTRPDSTECPVVVEIAQAETN